MIHKNRKYDIQQYYILLLYIVYYISHFKNQMAFGLGVQYLLHSQESGCQIALAVKCSEVSYSEVVKVVLMESRVQNSRLPLLLEVRTNRLKKRSDRHVKTYIQ